MGSYRSIAALAIIVFASAMMGFAIHHVLDSGTCSTTGYTRYGPAPRCSSSSTAWGIVLPIATFAIIAGGALGATSVFVVLGPLFFAVGIGALTVHPATGSSTPPELFELVFGLGFALPGAALLAYPVIASVRDGRPGRSGGVPPARIAGIVAASLAGLALASGVASLFPTDHVFGAATAATAAPASPTGATFPVIGATDPDSLYRKANFARALTITRFYFGPRARLRSLRLVPGGVDIGVVLGAGRRQAKDISIDSTGGYLANRAVALAHPARTFAISSLAPSSPATLAARLAATATRIDHMDASPDPGGGVRWHAYPRGGGPPASLSTR